MLLNTLMEGETVTSDKLLSTLKCYNNEKEGTIKALLKNFILPETDMAIKENQRNNNSYMYAIPSKPLYAMSERMKSINEAKQAFLNSTVHTDPYLYQKQANITEPTLHYAQIAITTESEDTRSTGGGEVKLSSNGCKARGSTLPTDISNNSKKKVDQQHRKVSFKIKNASTSYKKPPLATKTMVTITSTKVSELTKKFNDLVNESQDGTIKQSKLAQTIEDLQTASRYTASNSSSTSSTLSSSPSIKIVYRQRRGSKRRNAKKRCSSMDSIDKLILSDSSSAKIRVIRSKSDGTKIPKSPKKREKPSTSTEYQSGSDSVDGIGSPTKPAEILDDKKETKLVVKNVVKKFECEIIAQSSRSVTLKQNTNQDTRTIPRKEKPKVPEKKSSLVLTKNIVVKDGVPKIRTIKMISDSPQISENSKAADDVSKRKEPLYDKHKFKTNYIHSEKLPLQLVEIIQEDIDEITKSTSDIDVVETFEKQDLKVYDDVSSAITPNDSFLWRKERKSSSQIYSDSERSITDSTYTLVSMKETTASCETLKDESPKQELIESQKLSGRVSNSDFESNLVEACNEVLVGYTSKPTKAPIIEDDYEPLEPVDNIVVIPVKQPERLPKINCPLPEIPKESPLRNLKSDKENIYQCLFEMRSHPEGDECSIHNYEMCAEKLEERTRGDGDSDDGYEYCKSLIKPYCVTSSSGIHIAKGYQPSSAGSKNFAISKSVSSASTASYEKIGSERIYEKIPARPPKSKDASPSNSFVSYITYNESENIYDTIKQADGTSLSHCYESIPNSPSVVKFRDNLRKQFSSANVQKRLSFDTVSNLSHSTMSSEQKTNSIYGQRSVLSYSGQEIAFHVPTSETSVSDRSDRSDDWVDVSDEEKNDERKIIIVRERSRGRKSPVSWSQKVRHQWQKTPKPKTEDRVFITSPSIVYIDTSAKCSYYSQNDEEVHRVKQKREDAGKIEKKIAVEERVKLIEALEHKCWLNIRTVLRGEEFEIQDLVAFIDCDSSDSGHLYESLEPTPAHVPAPLDDDFDSFDSDTDSEDHDRSSQSYNGPPIPASTLPAPPSGGPYTLTKIANAAQRKMREIKRNLTKRYSVAMDGNPFAKTHTNGTYDVPKTKKSPIYANYEKPKIDHIYSNINFNDLPNKTENGKANGFKDELRIVTEKRLSYGDVPPPLPEKHPEKPSTPTSEGGKKDGGTLSRKTYFSFKSRFRRASSMAVDINSDVPSALKITNSTFYLTDSVDGDSGFSNCSDPPGSTETLSPTAPARRRDGTKLRGALSESSPCLALTRPAVPPPPPPIVVGTPTDVSAVNEELKRLLPTLSRKDKSPRTRTSWYAECGADTISNTSNTSWYAEAGLSPAGNISSSSGASSGSHPASPLPHSLFTHEPLYQFYTAAKIESACRETGDSDSDAYDVNTPLPLTPAPVPPPPGVSSPPPRPSAMALVSPRGPARTLWCEVPEVVNSTVLSSLAPAQKRLQEAKFELLTSEASYLNSLNVLAAHFISHPAFRETHILPRADFDALFSTILPVRKCSQLLMNELEKCWQDNILLQGICDIVRLHAEKHFSVYVKYCEQQASMVRALQRLRETPNFANALKRLESHPACQSLSLHSFLMLPMQRVTRLPLLLDALLKNLTPGDEEFDTCRRALATLNNFVSQCNEGARNTERVEEMFRISNSIEFPCNVDAPSLGPACSRRDRRPVRWLVRSGEMTQLLWKSDELKLTFGKKFHKVPLYLFLFNDLLVITKKKSESSYSAVDWCSRSLLEVCSSDVAPHYAKHAVLLTLLENREGRTIEMLMSCVSETELSRWSEALSPPTDGGAGEGEAVYAGWDCPQVAAVFAYCPLQPDELALTEGDVVNVTRKTSEGWYYGERTRDGEAGWFPGAYTQEIASPHVRARNLRQRYRLLALSGTYLGQKKRP